MNNVVGLIPANFYDDNFGKLLSERPLASLPFGGRYRLIDFTLSNMANCGIKTVGLVMPYRYRSIIDHIGVGRAWSLARKRGGLFVLPGSVYGMRNTDAKLILRDLERNKYFLTRESADYVLACNCNIVANIDFEKLIEEHKESKKNITFVYKDNDGLGKCDHYLKVEDDKVKAIYKTDEKDSYKFLDCFVINREYLLKILDWYKAINYMDIVDVIASQVDMMDINAYKLEGYSKIINDLDVYLQTNMDLLDRDIYKQLFCTDRPITTKIADEAPAIYREGADVKNSLVSTGCIIEGKVENSILFRSVYVKKGAVVKNSIIMQHGIIEENAYVSGMIGDKYSKVSANSHFESAFASPFIVEKYSVI